MEITLELPESLVTKFAHMGYTDPLDGLQEAAKLLLGLGPEAWATITAAAEATQTTPAKIILAKLNQPAPTPAEPAKAKRTAKVDNTERDAQIWELARTGSTHAKIAVEFGLSVIRVSQIVALQRAKAHAETLDK